MMVEKPISPQQSSNQIIQRAPGGLVPDGTEFPMVPVKAEKEITIIEVADEVRKTRLEVQVLTEVASWVKEVAKVAEQGHKITTEHKF